MIYENQTFDQERALYGIQDSLIKNCRFAGPADGESFLKECKNIEVSSCRVLLSPPLLMISATITADIANNITISIARIIIFKYFINTSS